MNTAKVAKTEFCSFLIQNVIILEEGILTEQELVCFLFSMSYPLREPTRRNMNNSHKTENELCNLG
jgi:hypothetical protein